MTIHDRSQMSSIPTTDFFMNTTFLITKKINRNKFGCTYFNYLSKKIDMKTPTFLTAFFEFATAFVPLTALSSLSGARDFFGRAFTGRLGLALSSAAITAVLELGCTTLTLNIKLELKNKVFFRRLTFNFSTCFAMLSYPRWIIIPRTASCAFLRTSAFLSSKFA